MLEPLSGSAANSIGQRVSHAKPHSRRHRQSAGTGLVDGQPDRPSAGLFIRVQEAGDDVLGFAARTPAAERHENDLVAVEAWPVPTAMFADEGAAAVLLGKTVRRVESKPQRSDVRAQRIVGNNRLLDQIRTLPFLPPRFIAPERPVPHLSNP